MTKIKNSETSFSFCGEITNKQTVLSQLHLTPNTTEQALFNAAYELWGHDLNQHIAGDYSLVLPLLKSNTLFCCLSAFSSHNLYYRENEVTLYFSNNFSQFNHNAIIDQRAIAQLLDNEFLLAPQTLFKHVKQLQNGESQLWQLSPEPVQLSTKQLSLLQKIQSASSDIISVTNEHEQISYTDLINSKIAFNQLPEISRTLNSPITDSWQLIFYHSLLSNKQPHINSNEGVNFWLALMEKTPYSIETIPKFKTKILRPKLKKSIKDNKQTQQTLLTQYHQEMCDWSYIYQPNFYLWLALSFELPSIWSQQRLIAERLNKTINFVFTDSKQVQHLLSADTENTYTACQSTTAKIFNFNDPSINNIFDAMQRLMLHGFAPVTHKLFHIVPPISAKLLKQYTNNAKHVENFCFHSLTLDHLARHFNWSLE